MSLADCIKQIALNDEEFNIYDAEVDRIMEDGTPREEAERTAAANRLIDLEDNKTEIQSKIDEVAPTSIEEVTPEIYDQKDDVDIEEAMTLYQKKGIKNLIVQHNLSLNNLIYAEKIGGLAAPSIAVTKKDLAMESFGEISLVGGSKMVDPSEYGAAQLFDADIYSPRYPRAKIKVNTKKLYKMWDEFDEASKELGGSKMSSELDESEIAQSGTSALYNSSIAIYAYLKEKGKRAPKIKYEEKPQVEQNIIDFVTKDFGIDVSIEEYPDGWQVIRNKSKYGPAKKTKAEANEIAKKLKEDRSWWYQAVDPQKLMRDPKFQKLAMQSTIKDYNKIDDKKLRDALIKEAKKLELQDLAYRLANKVKRAIKPTEVDFYAMREPLRKKIKDDPEFMEWAQSKIDDISKGEVIPSESRTGNVRWIPHTLDNVVNEMTKKIRDGEGFNYGIGNVRATAAKRFKSISSIKGDADRLISSEDMQKVKDEIGEEFDELAEELRFYYKYDREAFGYLGEFATNLTDAVKGKGLPDYKNVPSDLQNRVSEFLNKLKNADTEYFEGKFKRAVDIGEFTGAAVPRGKEYDTAIEILKNNGITNIRRYTKRKEGDYQRAMRGFKEEFFQPSEADKQRASIQFTEDNESIIRLTRASDLSSFLHESGHLFLEMEKRFAAKYGTSDEIQPLLDWLGVDNLENLTIEHHEKFAETFEVYLREGKSPSLKLRDAFAAFARWLSVIYRKLTDPRLARAEFTPEIREYMDRMLATEVELEQAMANPMYDQFFESKEAAGMTQEQWDKYLKQRDKVKLKASPDLIDKAMNELRKRKTKEWKEEREPLIDEELDRLSKERAYAVLNDTSEFPMDYEIVMEELDLEKQPGKLIGKLKKGGTDPAEYAEVYGYNSVAEMIEDIITVPPIKKAATDAAEARMIDKYGDILNDGTLELEARESLHNDEQAKLLIQELRILSKGKGKPAIDREYLKAKAKETMESMKYKEIKPNKYYRAEITAAKKSVTAKTDADRIAAKTQQVVNHYLYREAIKFKDRMDKQRKYVKTVQKREYKARDVVPDFSQNMRTLANLYDLRNKVDQIRDVTMLLQWYDAQLADENQYVEIGMLDPNLVLALEARGRGELPLLKLPTFDDLTASDLQGLYDNLRHLRYVGGQLAKGEKGELALEIRALAEHIDLQGGRNISGTRGIPTKHENLKRQVQTMINKVPSLRNLIRKIDGFEEDGLAYRMIYRVIEDANSHKLQLAQETYDKFNNELDGIHKVGLNRTNTQDYTLESGEILTIHPESRFMMAMYWGIESSREAIREGFGVTDADVMMILSDMTQEQLELVNATWKINESMWPELSEAHVKLVGVAPPKLDPASFTVNGVKMTGGHMRLFYDSSEIELKAIQEDTGGYASIMPTKAGSLHARVGSGGRPPALDKNNIVRSLEDNIHYISFAGASNRIRSFINSRDVKGAIERKHGVGFYNALLETIDGITGDRKQREQIPALASMFRLLRRAATFKHLAYSIRNTVQQVTAVPIAMEEVGMVAWTNQLVKFASPSGHKEIIDFVTNRSKFMANRASLVNREAAEYLRGISVEGELAHMWTQFARFGFTPQTIVDSIIAFPVWMAKYEQEINEHADEAKAASAADSSVAESVGSGSDLHLGGVFHSSNSEFVRMFTIFGTWFNAYYQRIYKSTKGFDDLTNAEAVKALIISPFIVGVLAALIVMDGPADDEEYWTWAMKRYGAFLAGTVPILRDIVGAFSGFAPKTVFSGGGEAPAKLAGELKALIEGKQTPLKAASDITKIATGIVPVPGVGNITRVMDYMDSYNKGREGNFNAYQAIVEGPERNK